MVGNPPAMQEPAGDTGLIPGSGRSHGEGHGNPLQYSYLENPMDRGGWRATVHRVRKNQTWLRWLSMHSWRLHWWTIQGSKRYCFVITVGILHLFYCIREDMFDKNTAAAASAKSLQSCLTLCDRPHRRQPTRLPRPWDSPGKNTGVGCHFLLQFMKVKSESEVAQSCPTPSDPMDCSLPGSPFRGIFQARVLEWVAIAFSRQEH